MRDTQRIVICVLCLRNQNSPIIRTGRLMQKTYLILRWIQRVKISTIVSILSVVVSAFDAKNVEILLSVIFLISSKTAKIVSPVLVSSQNNTTSIISHQLKKNTKKHCRSSNRVRQYGIRHSRFLQKFVLRAFVLRVSLWTSKIPQVIISRIAEIVLIVSMHGRQKIADIVSISEFQKIVSGAILSVCQMENRVPRPVSWPMLLMWNTVSTFLIPKISPTAIVAAILQTSSLASDSIMEKPPSWTRRIHNKNMRYWKQKSSTICGVQESGGSFSHYLSHLIPTRTQRRWTGIHSQNQKYSRGGAGGEERFSLWQAQNLRPIRHSIYHSMMKKL